MKKYISVSLLALLIPVTYTFAQKRETRNVSTFTKIEFRIPGKLYLRQGSPQKIEIDASSDNLHQINSEVDGNSLVIDAKGKWKNWNGNDDKIAVYITVENINGISVSGSGDVIAETKIISNSLDVNVSGSGSFKAEVEIDGEIDTRVSGSGNIDLKGNSKSFDSNVSGSGKVALAVNVSNRVAFGVSGSGKIEASGKADFVKTSISGSGKVLASNFETNKCEVRISGSGNVEISVKEDLDAHISGSGSVSYRGNPSHINTSASGSGHVRKM
jgi:hypothetical protein